MNNERPWWVPDIRSALALLVILAVIVLTFILVFHPIKDSDDVTKMVIGGLMTVGFVTIVNFFFGSSKGSSDKDAALMNAPPPVVPQPPIQPKE